MFVSYGLEMLKHMAIKAKKHRFKNFYIKDIGKLYRYISLNIHNYTRVSQKFCNILVCASLCYALFTNPSARAGYDTRSIFKWSLTGLNSEFSFS